MLRNYIAGLDSWDWVWVVAVGVLIGGWSLRTMPLGSTR